MPYLVAIPYESVQYTRMAGKYKLVARSSNLRPVKTRGRGSTDAIRHFSMNFMEGRKSAGGRCPPHPLGFNALAPSPQEAGLGGLTPAQACGIWATYSAQVASQRCPIL